RSCSSSRYRSNTNRRFRDIRTVSGIHPIAVTTSRPVSRDRAGVDCTRSSRDENERAGGHMSRTVLISIALSATTVMTAATTVHADVGLDWNAHAAQAIVTIGGQVPPRALIRLAMVHLAIYDAVNAIAGGQFESYASAPRVDRPASPEAAAAAAAHDVLVALFPAQEAALDAKYAASLAGLPDDAAKVNGIAVGQRAARGILQARAGDGRDATAIYVPGSGPGVWVPTPPAFLAAQAPETPFVQPFALKSASQFRPDAPFSLTSEEWARDYNEVKSLGSAVGSIRTPDQ